MYVIHKSCRTPSTESYSGPTWDAAGISHLRRDIYHDYKEARAIAYILGKFNPTGFSVSDVMAGQ